MTDISAFQPEVWTSSSNEALKLFVTDPTGAINFQPQFTYPIFGDAESIYGYKDLVIYLCFDHFTFYPFLNIKYDKKIPNDDQIVDIKSTMLKYLPTSTIFKDEVKWVDAISEEKTSYKIPGVKLDDFTIKDEVYSVYKIDLKSSSGVELHKRLQILVLLFIEAGSYIDIEDELWELYVVYKEGDEPSLVGYATVYNYWKYPGFDKFDKGLVEIRKKISQFIVLPNHQGNGVGGTFYNRLYSIWANDDKVKEIVVEDPNESFDDMRDRSDLVRISRDINFDEISTAKITKEWFAATKAALKLETRQLSRLLEMILLHKLKRNTSHDSKKSIRLFIKTRLYNKNREGLVALDEATRKDKLQSAYESLESDYYRILGNIDLTSTNDPPQKKQRV